MTERLLIHGACADAYHDFSEKVPGMGNMFNPSTEKVAGRPGLFHLRKGLPTSQPFPYTRTDDSPDKIHKEAEMLQELFQGPPFCKTYTVPPPIKTDDQILQNICQALVEAGPVDGEFKTSRDLKTVNGTEQYTIKLLSNKTGETNIKVLQSVQAKTSGKHKGRPFRPSKIRIDDLYKLFGSNNINLLFDACCIVVPALFKNALVEDSKQSLNVNWLINREFLNDPATKPMNHDPHHLLVGEGRMNFRFLIESSKEPITYTRYEPVAGDNPLKRNLFFSTMDFKLAHVKVQSANADPTTILEVNADKNIFITDQPNITNQIGSCCAEINISMVEALGTKDFLPVSCHYQRKRSGDWLQALSCLDTGRLYYDRNSGSKTPESLVNKNIILVTHDRILLWYALMQGLDVLYAGGKTTAAASSSDDDEDDGDVVDKLYLIYFSNNKRSMSKADIEAANLRTATGLLPLVDQLIADIDTFNARLEEIKTKRARDIEIKFSQITSKKKENIKDLLVEFIKYNSLDYTPSNKTELVSAKDEFLREKSISNALLFISVYNTFRLRMDTLSTKEAIESSDNSSSNLRIFNGVPALYDTYESLRAKRSTINPVEAGRKEAEKLAVMKLAAYISSSLNVVELRKLRAYIDGYEWNELRHDFIPTDNSCINKILAEDRIDVSLTNLNMITSAIVSKLTNRVEDVEARALVDAAIAGLLSLIEPVSLSSAALNAATASASASERPSVVALSAAAAAATITASKTKVVSSKSALDAAKADLEAKKGAFDDVKFKRLRKKGSARKGQDITDYQGLLELHDNLIPAAETLVVEKQTLYEQALAEAESPDSFVPEKKGRGARGKHVIMSSIGTALKETAGSAERELDPAGGSAGGGDKDLLARILFISYINELITAMNGFDSEDNLDYQYFEGLSRLVISHLDCIDKQRPDYKNIIQFLYNEIPNGQWYTRGDFATYTAVAGGHISLKAVNRMTGDIPDFGYRVELYNETVTAYEKYVTIVKGMSFADRHWFCVSKLIEHLRSLPDTDRDFSKEPTEFFQHIHSLSPNSLRKLVADSKLNPRELTSFMTAYKRALPMLNKPNVVNMRNRRTTVKAGILGGLRKNRKTVKTKKRGKRRSLKQ